MILKAIKKDKEIDKSLLFTNGYKIGVKVTYKCDECGKIKTVNSDSLLKHNHTEEQICLSCSIKLNNIVENRKKTCIEKYGSDNPMKVKKFVDKYKEANVSTYESQRNDFEEIKKSLSDRNYKLLSDSYSRRTDKLEYICPEGHRGNISWSSWRRGSGCKECGHILTGKKLSYTIEEVRGFLSREGYTLLSDSYKGKKQILRYRCPLGHEGNFILGNWLHLGTRCASCSHIVSRAELEIYDFVKQYFPNATHNDRTLISPLELDIVIPSKKIAIEYCGLHWHSELAGKDKLYHYNKLQKCQSQGYNLITIFEDEWIHNQEIVKSRLRNILSVYDSRRIFARKCIIHEITNSVKNEFINANHIQGADTSSIRLGAFYEDELVSVMTFSKGSIAKGHVAEEYVYELNRFCSKINTDVIGIASKLLTFFEKNYNPKHIFSYADKRWSIGGLYERLGFDMTHSTRPNYWYIIEDKRVHRYNFRRSELPRKLSDFDPDLTEWKNMIKHGYDRIWDCGNIKYTRIL
uniref:Putative Hef-like homing endonuclease n=1 Tax=viral metagenome TaxID=1070528 RepID=A0A6M3IDP3_9ZZZZ